MNENEDLFAIYYVTKTGSRWERKRLDPTWRTVEEAEDALERMVAWWHWQDAGGGHQSPGVNWWKPKPGSLDNFDRENYFNVLVNGEDVWVRVCWHPDTCFKHDVWIMPLWEEGVRQHNNRFADEGLGLLRESCNLMDDHEEHWQAEYPGGWHAKSDALKDFEKRLERFFLNIFVDGELDELMEEMSDATP